MFIAVSTSSIHQAMGKTSRFQNLGIYCHMFCRNGRGHVLYILAPVLNWPLSPLLSEVNLRLGKYQCLNLFLFKHNCVWVEFETGRNCCQVLKGKYYMGRKLPCIQLVFISTSKMVVQIVTCTL